MDNEKIKKANDLKWKIDKFRELAKILDDMGMDVFEDYVYDRITETTEPIFKKGINFIKDELSNKIDELQKQFDAL